MENLEFSYQVDYTDPIIYVKDKHIGIVNAVLDYVEKGGNLSDIYNGPGSDTSYVQAGIGDNSFILKIAQENERWAAVSVARAILRGTKVMSTAQSDIFCSGCSGGCAK